ncbi:DUF6816 family protein [Roseofilum casamattae]|uniref:DUF6816 domain-containing protein n=1 Tax=Roseofilum casamattae BLCC-M143 TaxID=3022442 RepID=A0ABT7C4G4_9CYAN|nr:hypothetical protein [Roseofilum casamattae]MDJ1185824.1 hypothetical protein [Roseofilum casamattae BLCC-M143]
MKNSPNILFALLISLAIWAVALPSQAGPLGDRLSEFPQWTDKPPVMAARGDLIYPDWMEGTWEVTSTLVDMVAPLAPDLVTPGFEANRDYLDRPIAFHVRFQPASEWVWPVKPESGWSWGTTLDRILNPIIADREFNGSQIAKAYLGDNGLRSVKVDPNNPNREIIRFGSSQKLISIVTGRATENPNTDEFISSEVAQQIFRQDAQIYLNEVETTTAYHRNENGERSLQAEQVTAIYLSPQDPNYFRALSTPVALYRYQLTLSPVVTSLALEKPS